MSLPACSYCSICNKDSKWTQLMKIIPVTKRYTWSNKLFIEIIDWSTLPPQHQWKWEGMEQGKELMWDTEGPLPMCSTQLADWNVMIIVEILFQNFRFSFLRNRKETEDPTTVIIDNKYCNRFPAHSTSTSFIHQKLA